jgi:hypothetical protein
MAVRVSNGRAPFLESLVHHYISVLLQELPSRPLDKLGLVSNVEPRFSGPSAPSATRAQIARDSVINLSASSTDAAGGTGRASLPGADGRSILKQKIRHGSSPGGSRPYRPVSEVDPDIMQNFIQTLIHPDREENPQRAEVTRAANLLQVGEFQFLQLAYKEWFSEEMPEPRCNSLFMGYMLYDKVPHWARHYARRILALYREGTLNGRDPFYHRYDSDYHSNVPQGTIKFCAAVAIVVVFIAGILWIGHMMTDGESTSILPPYFEKKELVPTRPPLSGS